MTVTIQGYLLFALVCKASSKALAFSFKVQFLSVETISSNHWGLLSPSSLWSLHVFFSFHHWLLMVPSSTQGLPDNPNCLPSSPVKTVIAFKRLSDAIIWTRQKVSTVHFILCFLATGIWCGTWQKARASLVSSFKKRVCVCARLPVSFKGVSYGTFQVGCRLRVKSFGGISCHPGLLICLKCR